jgi:hypothetical protein
VKSKLKSYITYFINGKSEIPRGACARWVNERTN